MVGTVTGWKLAPDGQWIVKIVRLVLGTQAHTAWTFRKNPLLELAKGRRLLPRGQRPC